MSSSISLSHAKKLRFLRKLHDKKQTDLAQLLGLTQQAYSKLENGDVSFTDETIEKIADYFKITPAEFEKPIEAISMGSNNNNSNTGTHISTIDLEFIGALQQSWDRNTRLLEMLLDDKTKQIKELEKTIEELKNALQNKPKDKLRE